MPRPSNTKERRSQIARAFIELMATKGYERSSMSQLAITAGLNQGLIHYHFQNKQEILLAAFSELKQQYNQRLEQQLAVCENTPSCQLNRYMDFHLGLGAYANQQALACWLVISTEALRQPKVQKQFAHHVHTMRDRLAQILRDGVTSGEFQCQDTTRAAAALIATIQGYFIIAATSPEAIPKGSAAEMTKTMAYALLSPEDS